MKIIETQIMVPVSGISVELKLEEAATLVEQFNDLVEFAHTIEGFSSKNCTELENFFAQLDTSIEDSDLD